MDVIFFLTKITMSDLRFTYTVHINAGLTKLSFMK